MPSNHRLAELRMAASTTLRTYAAIFVHNAVANTPCANVSWLPIGPARGACYAGIDHEVHAQGA
eukprot:7445325-Alexandrium_andersonii.AAC.1